MLSYPISHVTGNLGEKVFLPELYFSLCYFFQPFLQISFLGKKILILSFHFTKPKTQSQVVYILTLLKKTESLFFWLHSCVSTWTGSENCLYNGHLIHLQAFCNFSLPDPFYFKNNNSSDAGLLYYPLRFLYIPSTYKKYFCK